MEDDLKFNQREDELNFKLCKSSLASPSLTWAWHSSTPACYPLFILKLQTFIMLNLLLNFCLSIYTTRHLILVNSGIPSSIDKMWQTETFLHILCFFVVNFNMLYCMLRVWPNNVDINKLSKEDIFIPKYHYQSLPL